MARGQEPPAKKQKLAKKDEEEEKDEDNEDEETDDDDEKDEDDANDDDGSIDKENSHEVYHNPCPEAKAARANFLELCRLAGAPTPTLCEKEKSKAISCECAVNRELPDVLKYIWGHTETDHLYLIGTIDQAAKQLDNDDDVLEVYRKHKMIPVALSEAEFTLWLVDLTNGNIFEVENPPGEECRIQPLAPSLGHYLEKAVEIAKELAADPDKPTCHREFCEAVYNTYAGTVDFTPRKAAIKKFCAAMLLETDERE